VARRKGQKVEGQNEAKRITGQGRRGKNKERARERVIYIAVEVGNGWNVNRGIGRRRKKEK